MNKELLINIADWILPRNIFRLLTHFRPSALRFALTHRDVLRNNKVLFNRHHGERCFILCNGPSVKQQDIRQLKNEIVFSVSSGYLHPDYAEIQPRYHCVPQLTYGEMTPELAECWFNEMHKGLGVAELFLDHQEWALVQERKLFYGREVRYVCMGLNYFPDHSHSPPELTSIIPRAQTVPIMAIMIALYMGFKEIYLLGTDHDWFIRKEYKYFFEPSILKGKDPQVSVDGTLKNKSLFDMLPTVEKVWREYRALRTIANFNNAEIYNATYGGLLDEFQRINLADIFGGAKLN